MRKKISVLLTVFIIFMYCETSYAKVIDMAVVNSRTSSVRIEGNIKKGSSEFFHLLYTDDFENDTGSWRTIHTQDSEENLDIYTEADGNKCLSVSDRSSFSDGIGINISDYLNVHGMGKYTISFRMRAAEDPYVKKGTMSLVVMPHEISDTKYTKYISPVTDQWQTYSYTINITSFGQDDEGNPLQICPKGELTSVETDGDLYIRGWDSRYYIDDEKEEFVNDLRNYFIDDFSIQYSEKILSVEGEDPLRCNLTVKSGSEEIYSSEFMSNSDGSYDYSTTIPDLNDYGNVSLNLKCEDTKIDETVLPNLKNNEPDFSFAYEDGGIRIGIYPYDYIDFNKCNNPILVASVYNGGKLADIQTKEITPTNSNEMVKFHFNNPGDEGVVKLYVWDDLKHMVPICEKKVKDMVKENHMVYLIGDSICYSYDASRWPLQGWSYLLPEYFDSSLKFKDCSGGGLSTKSYIDPIFGDTVETRNTWKDENDPYGTWDKIQQHLKPGDFVIMGLGVNDTSGNDNNPYSKGTSEEVYARNLRIFAEDTKKYGAEIIFTTMTLHAGTYGQNNFENENTLKYRRRAEVMMKTADELGVTYVDLGKFQLDYYYGLAELLGGDTKAYDKVRDYFHGGVDVLHYNINGANKLAQFVAYLIRNSNSDMSKYAKDFEITYELEDVYDKYAPSN